MRRYYQVLMIASALGLSWLLMQAIHELGHAAAAWLTGGTVREVVLHPLTISRTDIEPNPRPLIVAWGGPTLGTFVPVIVWGCTAMARLPLAFLAGFFAGFCLIANGMYLGIGSFDGIGDAGDILRLGSPAWTLWLFGLTSVPAGLSLWNGLSHTFGLSGDSTSSSPLMAYGLVVALAAVAILELVFSDR